MPTTITPSTPPINKAIKQVPSSITIRSDNDKGVKISDKEMYGSNQTTFLTETEKHIKQVGKFLQTDSFEFNDFLNKIGSCRQELARTQKESSMHDMGKRRDKELHTLISQPYYADRALELYKNLEQTAASSSDVLEPV